MDHVIWSVDWGTSSLRVRLVDYNGGGMIAESLSGNGIAATYDRWGSSVFGKDRTRFYLSVIHEQMRVLAAHAVDRHVMAVVISGMATSTIGIEEVPYAPLPFAVSGQNAATRWLEPDEYFPYRTLLVSGVTNTMDIMRGEEIQLTGLAYLYPSLFDNGNVTGILPGTHSKHAYVRRGEMYSFKTYMTGELFSLLIKHSILKNAVEEPGKDKPLEKAGTGAFLKGLHQSQYPDLLHQLFSLRVNRLFEKLSPLENYYYLSGLLIGAELRSVNGLAGDRIVLCCGSNMFALYRLALEGLELMPHTYLVDPQVMDQCVTAGHLSVLRYKMPHW